MKKLSKIYYVIFITLIVNSAASQITGVKFAPDRTHWSESGRYRVSSTTTIPVFENIFIAGDTLFGNRYCQKIYSSKSQYFDSTCMQFTGYLYYKNRRLYTDTTSIIDTSSTLIYDFNLNATDTFNFFVHNLWNNGNFKIAVDHCDSMYYGNHWRKRIVFKQVSNPYFCGPVTWVEGIGDIDHGLSSRLFSNAPATNGFFGGAENYYGAIDQCCRTNEIVRLNCFQETGYNTFGPDCTPSSCISTNVNETYEIGNIFAFSNPVADKLTIHIPKQERTLLYIYNNIGQEISVETIQNENAEYDVSDLSNGVYFLRMQLNNNVVTKKIIIQH